MGAKWGKKKRRFVELTVVFVAVGILIVLFFVGERWVEPRVAKEYCPNGVVISDYHPQLKGGAYVYYCRDEATGERSEIRQMNIVAYAEIGITLLAFFGVLAISARVVKRNSR